MCDTHTHTHLAGTKRLKRFTEANLPTTTSSEENKGSFVLMNLKVNDRRTLHLIISEVKKPSERRSVRVSRRCVANKRAYDATCYKQGALSTVKPGFRPPADRCRHAKRQLTSGVAKTRAKMNIFPLSSRTRHKREREEGLKPFSKSAARQIIFTVHIQESAPKVSSALPSRLPEDRSSSLTVPDNKGPFRNTIMCCN